MPHITRGPCGSPTPAAPAATARDTAAMNAGVKDRQSNVRTHARHALSPARHGYRLLMSYEPRPCDGNSLAQSVEHFVLPEPGDHLLPRVVYGALASRNSCNRFKFLYPHTGLTAQREMHDKDFGSMNIILPPKIEFL